MITFKRTYNNSISLFFGFLCLLINYLHSGWVGGFNTYSAGFPPESLLGKVLPLVFMTGTPSFFILWGYLSFKYFKSDESGFHFLKMKLIQFYPIYFISFIINCVFRYDVVKEYSFFEILLTGMGLYYEQGIGGGGNIYFVVLWIIITVSMFKIFKISERYIVFYCLICLIVADVLPHESDFCYIKYFGYYAAYFFGASLRKMDMLNLSIKSSKAYITTLLVIFFVAILTPILNYLGYYRLEIQYSPNSPEQLFFCFAVIFISYKIIEKFNIKSLEYKPFNALHTVGNNTYLHFIIHGHLIRLIVFLNSIFVFNRVYVQIFVISTVSFISIFVVLPYWRRMEAILIEHLFINTGIVDPVKDMVSSYTEEKNHL